MPTRTTPWPVAVPCWANLSVPDPVAMQPFYASVLGWSFRDGDPAYGGYVVAHRDGHATAGIAPLRQAGNSPSWSLFLASDDVSVTADRVTAAGGTVESPPMQLGAIGSMCLGMDPSGATFGVWQAGESIGCELYNEPGGLTWEDLRSTDPGAAQSFYREVFGYELEAIEMAGPDYRMFHLGDKDAPLGGMGPMMGMAGSSRWVLYFGVTDTDVAVSAAQADGGTLVAPAFDSPYGRMAGLADPAGAQFFVIGVQAMDS